MNTKITEITENKITIQVEINFNASFLNTEENIQYALNEAGSIATQEALKRYDTDGSSITLSGNKLTNKGLVKKMYQTPYGEVEIHRYVYQGTSGGKTYCPLDRTARIIVGSTPKFAKMISSKYTDIGAKRLQADLKDNHSRYISQNYIQDISNAVGSIITDKEERWTYNTPVEEKEVKAIGIGLDGTCMLMTDDGYRETMVGTIAYYDEEGERLDTTYPDFDS